MGVDLIPPEDPELCECSENRSGFNRSPGTQERLKLLEVLLTSDENENGLFFY